MKLKIGLVLLIGVLLGGCSMQDKNKEESFSFVLAADTRAYTGDDINMFRGACEAIKKAGESAFIISPGDVDPPDRVFYTMQKYIDKDIIWYPIIGNHEEETVSDMEWIRNHNKNGNTLPNIVNLGPPSTKETMYSFDYKNSHFIVLNEYASDSCDNCTSGDINDMLYAWLKDDLEKTTKTNIFVTGHEPAYPMPDIENQRFRHVHDCLNQYPENRDRFVKLLQKHNVIAYMVGHTHNYSIVKINNLWHIDAGHARGDGDKGAKSTFIKINVTGDKVSYDTYRRDLETKEYLISDKGVLN